MGINFRNGNDTLTITSKHGQFVGSFKGASCSRDEIYFLGTLVPLFDQHIR
jgi:hypothetical protein